MKVMHEPQLPFVILASGSPRRQQLLGELGVPFRTIVSDAPETLTSGLSAVEQAILLADRKARAVAAGIAAGLVLGADTMVVLEGEILGKPRDDADARAMLRRLSGRDHQVITGLTIVDAKTGESQSESVTTVVTMRDLTDIEIAVYVATGEPLDKAGAYAIQGAGAALIAEYRGCYANVVGLPLCATSRLLVTAGALPSNHPVECLHSG
jgi:septum formation protein